MRLYGKYLKLYFYFLVAAIPLVFIQKCEDAYLLPKTALLISALQFGYVALRKAKFDIVDILLGVFLVFYCLGFVKSGDRAMGFMNWLSWAAAACIFIYCRHALNHEERKKTVLTALISAFIASLYAVAQVFRFDLKGWVTDFSGRAFSSMGNPDFFGGFLVIIIPLCLFLFYSYGRKKISAALFVFFTVVLFLSQTRSSLFAFAVSLILMFFLFREYFKQNILVLLAAAAAGAVLIAVTGRFDGFLERIRDIGAGNADLQGRVSMWSAGLDMIKNNFFTGSGISSVRYVFDLYRPGGAYFETDHLHNDFIELAAESGIPAFAVFAAYIFFGMRSMLARKNSHGKIFFISAAALLVHAFFNFPFYITDTRFYFFLVMGLGLPVGDSEKPGMDTVVFAAIAGIAMLSVLNALTGSVYLNYGINYSRENKKAAGDMLAQAVKFYPGAKKYYYAADWIMKQGDAKNALIYSEKFLEKMPYSKTGCIQAGILAAEAGDLGKAAGFFNAFLRRYPDDADVLNNLGKAKFMLGKTAEAAAIFRKILAKDPSDKLAHESLMAVYMNLGMKAEAQAELDSWNSTKK
jgi:O-antigen ligase